MRVQLYRAAPISGTRAGQKLPRVGRLAPPPLDETPSEAELARRKMIKPSSGEKFASR